MNPFTLPPQLLTTPPAAQAALDVYNAAIAGAVAVTDQAEETLDATLDVLTQTHPDLAPDLDKLVELARIAGHEEGGRQDLDTLKKQFTAFLPYKVKLALFGTTKRAKRAKK